MAIRTIEEIMDSLRARMGENTDDDSISFLEDVDDTLNDLASHRTDGTDWKAKYEENDAQWRQRYRDRFFNKSDDSDIEDEDNNDTRKPKTFEDLFTAE